MFGTKFLTIWLEFVHNQNSVSCIVLKSNETSSTCCQDRNTFVKVFSKSNQHLTASHLKELLQCTFSEFIDESCKRESGMLSRSRFCINEQYVISKYTKVICANNATIENICEVAYNCE